MLKKAITLITVLLVLALLTGCRVVLVDKTLQAEEKAPEIAEGNEVIALDGNVQYDPNRLIIRGQTNLPQGTVLQSGLQEFPGGVEHDDVLAGKVEPVEEYTLEEQGEVNEDGSFLIVLNRQDTSKRYQVSLRFSPEIQPAEVQGKYGEFGERIGSSDGVYKYEVNGTPVTGIAKFAPLGAFSDQNFWYRGKYDLTPSLNESRPQR
ncbi:hypothetical protein [Bacillus sp. AK031]